MVGTEVIAGGASGEGVGAAGADDVGGMTGATGIVMGEPDCWNEPIGGGALETGGATMGAGCGINDPGNGGAAETAGGAAICPISGTTLGVGEGSGEDTVIGLLPEMGELLAVSSLITMPICTTASRHSVPQAIAEERSRSGVRVVEGGVTSC